MKEPDAYWVDRFTRWRKKLVMLVCCYYFYGTSPVSDEHYDRQIQLLIARQKEHPEESKAAWAGDYFHGHDQISLFNCPYLGKPRKQRD